MAELSLRLVQESWERPCASGPWPPAAGQRRERACDGGTGTARSSGSSRPCKGKAGTADTSLKPTSLAPCTRAQIFLLHPPLLVHLKQAPELPKEYLGSEALLGCSKCSLATDLAIIFTGTSP